MNPDMMRINAHAKMNTSDEPVPQLRGFIDAMEKWETETWKAMKTAERTATPDSFQSPARQQLSVVFEEFCNPKRRAYGRGENLCFASPSDYCTLGLNLQLRKFTSRRAVYVTESSRRGIASKFVYVLLKQEGRWLVDNKKALNEDGSETPWWL
jgi:hypothetical protein